MNNWGRYRVVGAREYRGHAPGEVFIANIDRNAMRRAVDRGDILLVERVEPELPARWGLPDGWTTTVGKE